MPRYSLKRLLWTVTIIALGLAFLRGAYDYLAHFETAENVARVSWLPNAASNVSYYKSYGFTAYEFDISEAEFRKWARRYELNEIGDSPIEVMRYQYVGTYAPVRKDNPSLIDDAKFAEWAADVQAEVGNGLYFSERRANGGGVTVAFDRDSRRAYFQSNPR
jgi:hypothetical protein